MVKEITTLQEFATFISEPSSTVIIDFWAEWCGPCMRIAPFFSELETKYPNVRFYKINTDLPDIAEVLIACNINAMPSFCLFVDGKISEKLVGASQEKLENVIKKFNPKNRDVKICTPDIMS